VDPAYELVRCEPRGGGGCLVVRRLTGARTRAEARKDGAHRDPGIAARQTYHVYAPDLPGLHTQGDDLDEAIANAREAMALYVEGLLEDGRPLEMGIIRRRLPLPT